MFRSTDRGDTWTAGADLTRAEDRNTLTIMGRTPEPDVLARNDGVSAWGTITTLAESPIKAGLLWAGTDDGVVQVTNDGGKTWRNVTDRIPALARKGRVSRVEPSRRDPGTVYVAIDRHQDDDFAPYALVSRDFGETWRTISSGLPAIGWINVIKEHPTSPNVLFAGTETGLFVSVNSGADWTRFTHGFPTVPVDDLVVHPRENDLVVATHGRSIYILDDVSSLSGMTPEVAASELHLFAPRAATILQRWKHESYSAQRVFAGPNPPAGALLTYWVKTPGKAAATISIRNGSGAVVRQLEATSDAGFNRVVWDLRSSAPATLPDQRGPFVVPGSYTVTVRAAGRESTSTVRVDPDPAFPMTDAERTLRFQFLTDVLALQASVTQAATELRAVREQLTALQEQLKRQASPPAPVVDAAAKLAKGLAGLQSRIGGGGGGGGEEGGGGGGGGGLRGRVSGLFTELDGSGIHQGTLSGPTLGQRQRLEAARADAQAVQADADRVLGAELDALNEEIARLKVPRLVRPR